MIQKTKKLLLNPMVSARLERVSLSPPRKCSLNAARLEAPRLSEEVNWTGVSGLASPDRLVRDPFRRREFHQLALCPALHPVNDRLPSSRTLFTVLVPLASWFFLNEHISDPALVRDHARPARCSDRGKAGSTNGGKLVTPVSALLIFVALILYILGQLFLKHAMEDDLAAARFKKNFAAGLSTMTCFIFYYPRITPAF
jgi:hypothetical protein